MPPQSKRDFYLQGIELFNAGSADATLTNWSVQYGSATGTGTST